VRGPPGGVGFENGAVPAAEIGRGGMGGMQELQQHLVRVGDRTNRLVWQQELA